MQVSVRCGRGEGEPPSRRRLGAWAPVALCGAEGAVGVAVGDRGAGLVEGGSGFVVQGEVDGAEVVVELLQGAGVEDGAVTPGGRRASSTTTLAMRTTSSTGAPAKAGTRGRRQPPRARGKDSLRFITQDDVQDA